MALFAFVGAPGTIGPASGGKVTAFNNISTVFTQVIAANPSRVAISFHNPGTQNLFVGPMVVLNSSGQNTANAPTNAAPGGAYVVYPAATLVMTGECQGAWGAFAAANATNPLTISESNITS